MEKTIYKSKNLIEDKGNKVTLFYWLLSKESMEKDDFTVYGIEVTKYQDGVLLDSEKVDAISYDKNNVLELMSNLADGNVTPFCLVSMVDEYISSIDSNVIL